MFVETICLLLIKKAKMIEAVIFDMDGLIIDSEPLWREAEINIFKKYHITLSEDDCRGTTGMRVDEVVNHWSLVYPEANLPIEQVVHDIMHEVMHLVQLKGSPLPGVIQTIQFLLNRKIPLALASASSYALIETVLAKLEIKKYFSVIMSAENMDYGKPHPQVFLETAKALKLRPQSCLVLEDSVYGVLAAKAAKMQVVAIPEKSEFNKKGFCIADYKLTSMLEFDEQLLLLPT